MAQLVKNLPVMQEDLGLIPGLERSLGWEDPVEKGEATHSSILAWRITWSVLSMGLQRVRHDWVTFISSFQFSHSVVSDSSRPHESQHARPPCPSPTPRVRSDSRPLSQWCYPAISSSVVPFSSCPAGSELRPWQRSWGRRLGICKGGIKPQESPWKFSSNLPPKPESAYFLLCAFTYTSDFTGGCPPLPLSEKRVSLELQLIIPGCDSVSTYKLLWKSSSLPE